MALFTRSSRIAGGDVARALDPHTPRGDLVRLAAHSDIDVRAAVASRVDAPAASLISLVFEKDARVREALAANSSSPLWVIQTLASDDRARIRDRALARLNALGLAE